ncbi:DNA polymerase III subunit delta [Bacillus sp. EAC]|uniref:DNA polymerase III subunit delta n=1 Tax=Bacillus sp. EAC TaxID=1978338 RepID=UPI0015C51DBA|nr:DNA polymerase III subunit delta [Bacillus sp. EAC]
MITDLHKKLKKDVSPMYLLVGTEDFLLQEAETAIVKAALQGEIDDFNFQTYDLKEAYLSEALEDAQTPSFFGGHKVIIIKSCAFLTAQKEKIVQDIEPLFDYIENPSPFTTVVFVAPFEKLDERKKVTKALKKLVEIVECHPVEVNNLDSWITEQFSGNVSISKGAVETLKLLVGNNLSILKLECEKLQLFVGDEGEVTAELVELMVAKTIEQNVFSLIEKTAARQTTDALKILHELLYIGEEPIKVVALLASQFRLLYEIKQLSSNGYSNNQIASSVGVSPGRVFYGQKQANHFQASELKEAIRLIAKADYNMKTGQGDKVLILEMLILQMNK